MLQGRAVLITPGFGGEKKNNVDRSQYDVLHTRTIFILKSGNFE